MKDWQEREVIVQYLGRYTYKTLKSDVKAKLEDLLLRLENDRCHSISKYQMDMLKDMWIALGSISKEEE